MENGSSSSGDILYFRMARPNITKSVSPRYQLRFLVLVCFVFSASRHLSLALALLETHPSYQLAQSSRLYSNDHWIAANLGSPSWGWLLLLPRIVVFKSKSVCFQIFSEISFSRWRRRGGSFSVRSSTNCTCRVRSSTTKPPPPTLSVLRLLVETKANLVISVVSIDMPSTFKVIVLNSAYMRDVGVCWRWIRTFLDKFEPFLRVICPSLVYSDKERSSSRYSPSN